MPLRFTTQFSRLGPDTVGVIVTPRGTNAGWATWVFAKRADEPWRRLELPDGTRAVTGRGDRWAAVAPVGPRPAFAPDRPPPGVKEAYGEPPFGVYESRDLGKSWTSRPLPVGKPWPRLPGFHDPLNFRGVGIAANGHLLAWGSAGLYGVVGKDWALVASLPLEPGDVKPRDREAVVSVSMPEETGPVVVLSDRYRVYRMNEGAPLLAPYSEGLPEPRPGARGVLGLVRDGDLLIATFGGSSFSRRPADDHWLPLTPDGGVSLEANLPPMEPYLKAVRAPWESRPWVVSRVPGSGLEEATAEGFRPLWTPPHPVDWGLISGLAATDQAVFAGFIRATGAAAGVELFPDGGARLLQLP